jgi:alkaline phosphatase
MKKIFLTGILFIIILFSLSGQYTTLNAHSHNDYENDPPFWLSFNNHFGSIEADIWAIDGELLVAHYKADTKPELTLDSLYIQPIVRSFRQNKGKAWPDKSSSFQLLIDLKTGVSPALPLLIEKLKQYPDVFNPGKNKSAVRIVISGNRPDPSEFRRYPNFIYFDGLLTLKYNKKQLNRIPLYSENLKKFTVWNGTGEIPQKDRIRLQNVIDSVHSLNKKIRFWNAPDDINAWDTFIDLGIDYINTDKIEKLADYLNKGSH